jgi:phenylpropionate dioxygenase-like ring-hydroxylating dioxygenase large terminal subunit
VRRRPVRRQIHGQPYWLWRDGGRLRAAEFRPDELPARRAAASEFTGGSGEYPLIERYGYAWVWYGNPEHADGALVPDVPYLPRDGKLPRWFWGTYLFGCTYELVCENLLDLTHADFLHSKLVGDPLSDDDQISVESTSETVTMIREAHGRVTPPAFRAITRAKRQDLRAVTHVHLRSGVAVLHGNFSPGLSVRLFHPNVPESTRTTRLDFTFNPKGGHVLARNAFSLCAPFVARQDDRMLRPQNPRYLQPSERADFSSRFDTAGLTYRKRMKQLAERQSRGDYSYGPDCDPGADVSKLLDVEREN